MCTPAEEMAAGPARGSEDESSLSRRPDDAKVLPALVNHAADGEAGGEGTTWPGGVRLSESRDDDDNDAAIAAATEGSATINGDGRQGNFSNENSAVAAQVKDETSAFRTDDGDDNKDQRTSAGTDHTNQEQGSKLDASIRVINQPNANVVEVVAGDADEQAKDEVVKPRRRRTGRRDSRVSFTTIEVREYDRIVGSPDPQVENPLSLDWNFEERKSTTVDDWEVSKTTRRGLPELFQNKKARKELLKPARPSGLAGSLVYKAKKILRRLDHNLTRTTSTAATA